MSKTVVLKPRLSEKSYSLSTAHNTYVFSVGRELNKHQVAQAVSEQFQVTVEGVRMANIKGKVKQSYRKGRRPVTGKRSDIKKAYVTLKSGDHIPIFAAEEAEQKPGKAKKTEGEKK